MADKIAGDPSMVERTNATFRFNVLGEPGAVWHIDLQQAPGSVVQLNEGDDRPADCTITMADGDLAALAAGKLNPMAAFGQGKIKVQGNMMLGMKLQSLF